MARPKPPPYAQLIARARLAPPKMTLTEASRRAGISDTRWSQLENGYRMTRGRADPEWAPADTLALMARVVGVTPEQLREAGREDAAGELAVLPPLPSRPGKTDPVVDELLAIIRIKEAQIRRLEGRETQDDEDERGERNAI